MIADALFKAAFDVLDKLPDDLKRSLAHRVYIGPYERFLSAAKDDDGTSKMGSPVGDNAPLNTLFAKSLRPAPPK